MNIPVPSVPSHEVYKVWWTDMRNDEVAAALGVTRGQLWAIAKRLNLPPRPRHLRAWADNNGRQKDDPTLEEIAERSAAIRAGWPDDVLERRLVGSKNRRYQIPAFRIHAAATGRDMRIENAIHDF